MRKNLSLGFLTRSDTNRAVQAQKNAGGLKIKKCFRFLVVFDLHLSIKRAFNCGIYLVCFYIQESAIAAFHRPLQQHAILGTTTL